MSRDLARHVDGIRRAEDGPDGLNAFVSLASKGSAAARTGAGADGQDGHRDRPLTGIPVAVKDNLATLDLPTTCGSRILEGYRSPFEATVVRKLRAAGALIVGKTNMDEFAMGSSTENSAFGPTLNPRDRARVPGGSSGGSAAAVAAGYVSMALGSDTGGSVRQPAALCGVVGIKPTYGRVSRYGLVAFASSLDQVGTFGVTVDDAARLLEVVAGHDPRDATSAPRPVPSLRPGAREDGAAPGSPSVAGSPSDLEDLSGLVVGVPSEYVPEGLNAGLRVRLDATVEALEGAGAEVRRVSLPSTDLAIPCYYVLAPAEASSNLARYDGVRFGLRHPDADIESMYEETREEGFGAEVKRRIMLGTYALSAGYYDQYYGAAQRARRRIRGDLARVFDSGVDVLFTPTTPEPAFRLGERLDDPLAMYLSDVFTVTANLAGVPAISVPIGTVDGLPVGGQIVAPWWEEARMIRVAAAVEALVDGRGEA